MEFAELILTTKLEGVILHSFLNKSVEGTLCITSHHLILSPKQADQELWVRQQQSNQISFPRFIVRFVTASTSRDRSFREETEHG